MKTKEEILKEICERENVGISHMGFKVHRIALEAMQTYLDLHRPKWVSDEVKELISEYSLYVNLLKADVASLSSVVINHGHNLSASYETGKACREKIESLRSKLFGEGTEG